MAVKRTGHITILTATNETRLPLQCRVHQLVHHPRRAEGTSANWRKSSDPVGPPRPRECQSGRTSHCKTNENV